LWVQLAIHTVPDVAAIKRRASWGNDMSSLLRRTVAGCVPFVFCSTLCHAAPPVQGRWEGQVQIPGAPLTLIVDLARNGASAWTGSVIIPGLGIKGAPVGDISVTESRVSFALSGAMKAGGAAPPRITVHSVREGVMAGDFEQAGNTATLTLTRTGPAHVEPAPKSTVVAGELEGAWSGRFELGGYPRDVTLTLSNHTQSGATAELVIVGKRTTQVPVDLVVQDAQFLKIESGQMGITFEGRWSAKASEIQGSLQMGPFEVPLVLHQGTPTTGGKS